MYIFLFYFHGMIYYALNTNEFDIYYICVALHIYSHEYILTPDCIKLFLYLNHELYMLDLDSCFQRSSSKTSTTIFFLFLISIYLG